jgi:small subunit ribosomal protein S2
MSTQIEDMFKAGAHYGVDIINIEKTYELFEKAIEQVSKMAASGKTILFVGTKAEAQQQIVEAALSLNMPYVSERWVGGALTNFPEIKKRIVKLLDLRDQKEKGGLDKYTKKERLLIDREMDDMTKNFQGLTGITRTPDALFVIDPKKEHIAVTEAHKMNLPVIAVLNTDCNLKQVEFPIIANDASVMSITYFVNAVKEAYNKGVSGTTK